MPKRPRSHRLEDESWKALNNAVPSGWVVRKSVPDYSIDGEIEIFDESGASTGLIFFIQLKGTDEKDNKKALSLRLPITTVDYYKSLQLSVLLIRYHAPTKKLYTKWASEIDLYYSRGKSKSVNIDFLEESLWTELTPTRLTENIKAFRKFRNPRISVPVILKLSFPEDVVFSVPASVVESYIRTESQSDAEIISFERGTLGLIAPIIKITNKLIQVDFYGLSSFNLHITKKGYSVEEVASKLPHDVLIGIAIFLHRFGHDAIATEIVTRHIRQSSFTGHFEVLTEILTCLILGKKFVEAIAILDKIIEDGNFGSLQMLFLLPTIFRSKMNDAEVELYKRLLLKAADAAKIIDWNEGAAINYYNLATTLRGREGKLPEAVHYYRMASKYDPSYKKRDYFWAEIAGLLFHLDKFNCAARAYNKAIQLGAPAMYMALQADALMFAGNYKESSELFKKYEEKVDKADSEWILKAVALDEILRTVKMERQPRKPMEAMRHADVKGLSLEESERRIKEALEMDALSGLAWFNRGVDKVARDDYCEALIAFLIAGLVQRNDVEAWANAVLCVINCKDENYAVLLPFILEVAYFTNGERFIQLYAKKIEEQPGDRMPSSAKAEIINSIGSIVREFSKTDKKELTLRFIKPDGTYGIIGHKE